MKKFEITFEGKTYDYLTRTTILEYLQSFFPKAEVTVKTIPQKKQRMMTNDGRKEHKKLWYVCTIIQNYCEAHNDCEFCPFHDYWNSCMIKNAAEVPTDELWKLFPENITEDNE